MMADALNRREPWFTNLWLRRLSLAGFALSCALSSSSCTRHFFREAADKEVDAVLAEKDKYPKWGIDQYHVYPDPRARFADPTCPDRPPKPPDDPAAQALSPNPQKPGKAGEARVENEGYLKLVAEWDQQNRAERAAKESQKEAGTKDAGPKLEMQPMEKPDSEEQEQAEGQKSAAATSPASTTALSRRTTEGAPRPYLLKLEQTVELGLINSREYQDAREDLYLTALPVTLERFGFAAQFFAVGQAIREWAGSHTPEGKQNNWTLNSNVGFSKLFSTGGLLLMNFANQTVLNLGGVAGKAVTSQSTINLDLVQPLLRGGGRAVTLEPLTQAERNLLYEIRNFARFREEFYVAIAGGGGGGITGGSFQPTGVIAPAGFTPGAGLGSSGLFPGVTVSVPVVGNPGTQVTVGASGRAPLATAFAAPVSGYLTTLLEAAQIRVDEYNIQKLDEFLKLAEATKEGGDISQLQVDQFEQSLLRGRTSLLMDQQQYLDGLDRFKLQLGLPTNTLIELDDAAFRPLNEQFQRYEDLFNQFKAASDEPLSFGTPELAPTVRRELRRIFTTSALVKGTRFRTDIEADWGTWEKLSADELQKRLTSYREERRQLLARQTDLQTKGQDLSPVEQQRVDTLNFQIDLGEFEAVLRDYESQPWKKVNNPEVQRQQQRALYRYVVNAFINVLIKPRNERIVQLRGTWPDLAKLCVNGVDLLKADLDQAENAVVQTALVNRFDLMNVRAQTVDAWRQVAVFANALLGTFNIQYHMDSSTPAGLAEPFAFAGSRTRHELFLNGQLPLVRLAERNNYRAALINYQRARRILQRAEDQVMFDTRGEIRLLRQQEENYRIQQRQVELGYLTVENSLDTFAAPPAPGTASSAGNAAALTNQLISAQTNLYNAQFAMTTIWITYLNTRLQLYRDMELMPLDFRGVWIDEVATCECPKPSDGQPGTGAGNSSGPRGVPSSATGARPERLPEPQPVAGGKVQGPWLDDKN
jgi:hypothetical protein